MSGICSLRLTCTCSNCRGRLRPSTTPVLPATLPPLRLNRPDVVRDRPQARPHLRTESSRDGRNGADLARPRNKMALQGLFFDDSSFENRCLYHTLDLKFGGKLAK